MKLAEILQSLEDFEIRISGREAWELAEPSVCPRSAVDWKGKKSQMAAHSDSVCMRNSPLAVS